MEAELDVELGVELVEFGGDFVGDERGPVGHGFAFDDFVFVFGEGLEVDAVEAKVAEILRAISPALPIPVVITVPWQL